MLEREIEPLWSLSLKLEYLTMVMGGCEEISGGMQRGCWRPFMVYSSRGLMKARTLVLNCECVCVCVCKREKEIEGEQNR